MGKTTLIAILIIVAGLLTWWQFGGATNEQTQIYQEKEVVEKIEKKTFGYSAGGRPIEGYEIGDGADTLLLFGSIHGNEMGSAHLLATLIELIKDKPDIVSETKKLIIIPIANPDGYYDRIDKLNANEVNLNRNFDTSDWRVGEQGSSYSGVRPFSEVESRVIKQLVDQYNPSVMIAYHARGALVTPEANAPSRIWARWYADKTGYIYDGDDSVWDFPGTATKWFIEDTDGAAFTVELTKYLESDWAINKEALLELVSSPDAWFF